MQDGVARRREAGPIRVLIADDPSLREAIAELVSCEQERRRSAAAIHDDAIQAMTAAGMRLQLLRRALSDPRQLGLLGALELEIQLSMSRLRQLLVELLPPVLERDGLAAALRTYIEEAGKDTDVVYRLEDALHSEPPADTRLILYRIAQEALTNIRKHAQASRAEIQLDDFEGGFRVRVADDGNGIAFVRPVPASGHIGLAAIQARAELAGGWLRIDGAAGVGTTVEFWIPGAQPSIGAAAAA